MMHETNKTDSDRLDKIIEGLEILNETLMACMVQLSRLYDVAATELYTKNGENVDELLNGHEHGDIFTTAPVLRSFGAPDDDDSEGASDE
jgi:hypothetical protein